MPYTVTRQGQWPTGENIVEVSEGGINYCNPDALVELYKGSGEFETFTDPREAAEVAIRVCQEWRNTIKTLAKKKDRYPLPKVGAGTTGGNTMPFDSCTFKQLRQWAKETWDKLEKCGCGEPLPDRKHRWHADDWSGQEFCSERCADKEIEFQQKEDWKLREAEAKERGCTCLCDACITEGCDECPDCEVEES